jgi:hypothetical protein
MHRDRGIDPRIKGLLSGLEKILSAQAEIETRTVTPRYRSKAHRHGGASCRDAVECLHIR